MDKVTHLDVKRQTLPTSKKVKGFAQIANHILLDQRLSFKARGILSLLLSRPEDWQIYINEVTSKSDKDGKRAVQSGFKELAQLGYLSLLPVYNDDTGRFDGTYYHLNKEFCLPRQPPFKTVEKEDCHTSSPSDIKTNLKIDLPKTASLSKKKCSNTKSRNIEEQQQQTEETLPDDVDVKKSICFFYEELQKDTNWQASFIGHRLSPTQILTSFDLSKLLLHFKQTSKQNGNSYENLIAAKRHFSNWFNVNSQKKILTVFIEQQQKIISKARDEVSELISKSDSIIDKLLQQKCTTVQQVLRYKSNLLAHQGFYHQKINYLQRLEERETVKGIIIDIDKLCAKIDIAQQTSQLEWFCKKMI